jgi:uncharacterized protein (DUF169 family)
MRGSIQPEPRPVGVKVLGSATDGVEAGVYWGVSYCDAVRRAGQGEALRVIPGSIRVCLWAPVVLGLKPTVGRFEEGLKPRLAFPRDGLLLAPLEDFPGEPEVVIARAGPERLRSMLRSAEATGSGVPSPLWEGHGGELDCSALPIVMSGQETTRSRLIVAVNRGLAALAPSARWQALTRRLFSNRAPTIALELLISHLAADMSICRNSTAIPLLTGRVNVSHFCTGGITWGLNHPGHLTSGWPWATFQAIHSQMDGAGDG